MDDELEILRIKKKINNINMGTKITELSTDAQAQKIVSDLRSLAKRVNPTTGNRMISKRSADRLAEEAFKRAAEVVKVKKKHFFSDIKTPKDLVKTLAPDESLNPKVKLNRAKPTLKLKGSKKLTKYVPFVAPILGAYYAIKGESQAATDMFDPSGSTTANPMTMEEYKFFKEREKYNAKIRLINMSRY